MYNNTHTNAITYWMRHSRCRIKYSKEMDYTLQTFIYQDSHFGAYLTHVKSNQKLSGL